MAVENIAPGDNGQPWLYVQTVLDHGGSVMFCKDPAAWQDTQRVAQNAADQTGQPQYLVAYPGTGHRVTHMVTPEPRRHQALGGYEPIMTVLCYFAYPIDHAQGQTLSVIANLGLRLNRLHGMAVYEPGIAWKANGEPDPRVQQVNDYALTSCDVVAAFLPDVRTIGVPMEIQRAIDYGIPVVVLVESAARTSWAIVGSQATVVESPDDWLTQIGLQGGEQAALSRQVASEIPRWVSERPEIRLAAVDGATNLDTPSRTHEGDAGFDLYVSQEAWLEPGKMTNVRSHLAAELPPGMWALLVGRSSTFVKRGLVVDTAIIDSGYRGELFACVFNPGTEEVHVATGERLAQLIPMPLLAPTVDLVRVPELSPSDRGVGGFGSTGH